MPTENQERKAEAFLALHHTPGILVLPNAWDVVSARIFELEGFRAIATTSAGVGAVLGYADGECMPLPENLEMVSRIARHLGVPVSADIEAGYAKTPEGVAKSIRATIEAGAVGVNLEDGSCDGGGSLCDLSLQVEKIRAAREAALAMNMPLVINARTDGFLVSPDAPDCMDKTLERAAAYVEAGADCIFVPDVGALDSPTIARLAREIDAPLNIIAGTTTPPITELESMGVARVTFGPRPMRAALSLIRKFARELRRDGTYTRLNDVDLTYAEVNAMFSSD